MRRSEPERYDVLRFATRIKAIREEMKQTFAYPDVMTTHSLGWFIFFEGSYEGLFVGHEKPHDLNVGDVVWITIQKDVA